MDGEPISAMRSKCGYSEIFGSCRTGGSYSQCTEGGELYLSSFASILQKLNSSSSGLQPKDAPTRRERAVLEAVAKGMNTHEIAALLKISENTVETFRKRLISKFGAKNAIDMVVKAVSQGWIKLD